MCSETVPVGLDDGPAQRSRRVVKVTARNRGVLNRISSRRGPAFEGDGSCHARP